LHSQAPQFPFLRRNLHATDGHGGFCLADLKPENVLITRADDQSPDLVKLADFGIAILLDERPVSERGAGSMKTRSPSRRPRRSQRQQHRSTRWKWRRPGCGRPACARPGPRSRTRRRHPARRRTAPSAC
jgi:serine/threonine protein kinase